MSPVTQKLAQVYVALILRLLLVLLYKGIMTSHVHIIIGSHQDKLEDIMHDMKMFISKL